MGNQTVGPNSTCVNVDMCELELTQDMSRVTQVPLVTEKTPRVTKNSSHRPVEQAPDVWLDQSDYNSLDMTNRLQLQLSQSAPPFSPTTSGQPGGQYASTVIINPFPRLTIVVYSCTEIQLLIV